MRRISKIDGFLDDRSGAIALIFALTSLVVVGVIGLAIDGGRAYNLATKQSAVLDAAALAGAKAMKEAGASDDQIKQIVKSFVDAHMNNGSLHGTTTGTPDVVIDRTKDTVDVTMTSTIQNYFGPILGYDTFQVAKGTTAIYSVKDVELGLMLDVSGSMGNSGKLSDLKSAVKDLLEILLPETPGAPNVRIGYAPYATSVNAGIFAAIAKGKGAEEILNKCVSERLIHNGGFTDDPPKLGHVMGSKPTSCPINEILPITSDKSALASTIDSYVASGSTAGHLGAAWAWYLVSPKWSEIWPSPESTPVPYENKSVLKAVVIMTDGMFNTEYEPDNGVSAEQAEQICTNMKAAGVTVFSVGFQAPAQVAPTLQLCASKAEYYFDAADGSALSDAFKRIADELTALRVKK